MNPFGRLGILMTATSKHRIQWGYSKFDPYINILYRKLGQYTAQNSLKFRAYNPGKITKYGEVVRMVCEGVIGYICNKEIYSAEGKKLEDTVLSHLERNLGQNQHICQDNFYNSVRDYLKNC